MKFGKTFVSHQIPEWSIYYMNYKHLKKIVKDIDSVVEQLETPAADTADTAEIIGQVLSQFFFELDRDIERVSDFYDTKFNEYQRRLVKIVQVLGYQDGSVLGQLESNDELEEIYSILLELRLIFRSLKWYGELNHRGFVKILKKLDKKLTTLLEDTKTDNLSTDKRAFDISNHNRETYLSTRVNALPFANELELHLCLDTISSILQLLGEAQDRVEVVDEEKQLKEPNETLSKDFDFLKIVPQRRTSFDQVFLENYYELIHKDDAKLLNQKLASSTLTLKFLISLLNKAAGANSTACIDEIFNYLDNYVEKHPESPNLLFDQLDISGRNFFHQHIILLGKKQALKEQKLTPGESSDISRFVLLGNEDNDNDAEDVSGLCYILKRLDATNATPIKPLLISKDNYNRTPLHYSAQYGLKTATNVLLGYLANWGLIDITVSIDDVSFWGDQEGLTPLHLSIMGKHPKTTENLIIYNSANRLACPDLILLAVRLNSSQILSLLISQGKIDINYTDVEHHNETALYMAAKLNLVSLVKYLLENGADTELGESVYGWTPIFIAACDGFTEVVQALLDHNCQYDIVDDSGWLPMEHACLRGHLPVADMLKPAEDKLLLYDMYHPENNMARTASLAASPVIKSASASSDIVSTLSIDRLPETSGSKIVMTEVYKLLRNKSNSSIGGGTGRSKSPSKRFKKVKAIKSFGHKFLDSDELVILITLGTTDLRDNSPPVELSQIPLAKSFSTELDTALSLQITCKNRLTNKPVEPPVIVDLPLEDHHGSATDPILFTLTGGLTPDTVLVLFDLIPTYQVTDSRKGTTLGRGVALLKDAYTKVGPNLRSLNNSINVPILELSTLDVLGHVRFEYLCVKSFSHKHMSIGRSDTYWKQLVSTRVIGHRGLGKNESGRKSLQLGENTVESFVAAASLGAAYVEFDVQLTKDYVPVVYHDFLVAESGVDIPMHSLTAEQFLGLSEYHQHDEQKSVKKDFSMDDAAISKSARPRAKSSHQLSNLGFQITPTTPLVPDSERAKDDIKDNDGSDHLHRRMKLTKTWKDKGFKGNARGLSVASNFVTLKELFKKVPKSAGFNIELKYPMLDEAEQELMGEIALDMNHYCDSILKVIYDENLNGRDILFSSFHPDICVFMSLKQPTIPILFLTEAGTAPMADIRASSLQNAIRFSKKWNLLGIVSAAGALVKTPRLTQVVKSSGLVCVTYGTQNNDPKLAKIQMKAGVDAVIVDSVLAVREGLRQDVKDLDDSGSSLN